MGIDLQLIQKLREETGAGIADVKEALESSNGDIAGAMAFLQAKGAKAAAKRADRITKEGIVHAYIHSNGKIGALIALGCETDFVAMNPAFKELANDIALHIVASVGDEAPLLDQPFIKDDSITIRQLIESKTGIIGEKIEIIGYSVQKIG